MVALKMTKAAVGGELLVLPMADRFLNRAASGPSAAAPLMAVNRGR